MQGISNFWDKIKRSPPVLYSGFAILSDHVISPQLPDTEFKADESYFELRICEHFLRDRREYWHEYIPLTVVLSEFIYDQKQRSFAFVVGPELLKNLEQLEGGEHVRYRNTRVVGPTPYVGDDVDLFIGLFRVKTVNWAKQALSFLESVAKAFDSSKLTNYLNISGPLLDGLEGFLGMGEQMEFRLGQRDAFVDSEMSQGNIFSPGYFVLVREDERNIEKEKFWVNDSKLFIGDNPSNLQLYAEQDYILYQINYLEKRNDYVTFDFHKQWDKIQDQIWSGNKEKAVAEFHRLLYLLNSSTDIISPQKKKLQLFYTGKFQEEFKNYQAVRNPLEGLESSGAEILETLSNTDDRLFMPLEKTWDYLCETSHARQSVSEPIPLNENDIQDALDSKMLSDVSITSLDLDSLTVLLTSGITKAI